jgi:tetratricopeptide (TPR) repeat protein
MKWKLLVLVVGLLVDLLPGSILANIKDDAAEAYRKWLQCVAEKGEDHEDCQELFEQFLAIAYRQLEEWEAEYQRNCGDQEKAKSEYCKDLAERIKRLREAIGGVLKKTGDKALDRQSTRLALGERWDEVYDVLSREPADRRRIEEDLLLGYASLYRRDWTKAWQCFSAVDKSGQKYRLLHWAESLCYVKSDNPVAFLLKGDLLARLGQYGKATEALDCATTLNRDLPFTYDLKGLISIMTGRLQEAANELDKAPRIKPSLPHTAFERAMTALIGGDFEGAESRLTELLGEEPNFFLARNARGVARVLQGKFEQALQDFDQAVRDNPDFTEAHANKNLTAMLRAKGLFTVDMAKVAALSPKGILGATASTNLYYAGAGINSPDGGRTLDIARQRSRPDPIVVTIRERDYVARGVDAGNPRLATEISTYISMQTRRAKAEGKDLVVSVIPNLENYRSELATDYMFGSPVWNESKKFCSTAMDATIGGFRQVEREGKTVADLHSMHVDVFANTKGLCFDQVNAIKGRTGGGLDDNFASRCREYIQEGKPAPNLVTGKGDIWSMGNVATMPTALRLANEGLVTSIHDKFDHGHSLYTGNSLYEVHTTSGTRTIAGDLKTLTGNDILRDFSLSSRSGVFLKLGDVGMDVTSEKRTDLSFLVAPTTVGSEGRLTSDREPDISHPFLIFNVTRPSSPTHPGGEP